MVRICQGNSGMRRGCFGGGSYNSGCGEFSVPRNLPIIRAHTAPDGQQRAFFRLNHLLFRLGDAALDWPWLDQSPADKLPLCAVVGITDSTMPLWDAVDAAGGAGVDLNAIPPLCAPLWAMSPKERAELLATRLPFIP